MGVKHRWKNLLCAAAVVGGCCLAGGVERFEGKQYTPPPLSSCYGPVSPTTTEAWRFGVGHPLQGSNEKDPPVLLTDLAGFGPEENALWLGSGVFFDWSFAQQQWWPGLERVPLVGGYSSGTVNPSLDELRTTYIEKPWLFPPGTTFFFANETPFDDGRDLNQVAQDYHDYYYTLKELDPTFLVTTWAILPENSNYPGERDGLEYFIAVREAYLAIYDTPLPLDIIRMNIYTAGSAEALAGIVTNFRSLMSELDLSELPLIVSEFGWIDWNETPPSPEEVATYLDETIRFLATARDLHTGLPCDNYRLVQRFFWFATHGNTYIDGGRWEPTALFDKAPENSGDANWNWTLSKLGEAYRAVVGKFVNCNLPTDVDGSGKVTVEDIMQVATNEEQYYPGYDFDWNGSLEPSDINLTAQTWRDICPPPS